MMSSSIFVSLASWLLSMARGPPYPQASHLCPGQEKEKMASPIAPVLLLRKAELFQHPYQTSATGMGHVATESCQGSWEVSTWLFSSFGGCREMGLGMAAVLASKQCQIYFLSPHTVLTSQYYVKP